MTSHKSSPNTPQAHLLQVRMTLERLDLSQIPSNMKGVEIPTEWTEDLGRDSFPWWLTPTMLGSLGVSWSRVAKYIVPTSSPRTHLMHWGSKPVFLRLPTSHSIAICQGCEAPLHLWLLTKQDPSLMRDVQRLQAYIKWMEQAEYINHRVYRPRKIRAGICPGCDLRIQWDHQARAEVAEEERLNGRKFQAGNRNRKIQELTSAKQSQFMTSWQNINVEWWETQREERTPIYEQYMQSVES